MIFPIASSVIRKNRPGTGREAARQTALATARQSAQQQQPGWAGGSGWSLPEERQRGTGNVRVEVVRGGYLVTWSQRGNLGLVQHVTRV